MVSLYEVRAKESEVSTQRSALGRVQRELDSKENHTDNLDSQIGQAITKLATLYLPGLNTDAMKAVPDQFRSAVDTYYQQKRARISQLDDMIMLSGRHIVDLEKASNAATSKLQETVEEQEWKQDSYNNALNEHGEYQRLRQEMIAADKAYVEAETEFKVREKRREEMQAEYLKDPFFKYFFDRKVHERGEDTFMRRVDKAFAKIYDYGTRKKRFDLFDAELWEADRNLSAARKASEETDIPVLAIEKEYAERTGLNEVAQRLEVMVKNADAARHDLEKVRKDNQTYREERLALEKDQSVFYRKAVETMVQTVTGMGLDGLRALARETPNPEDDGLVDRLDALYDDLEETNKVIATLRQQESREKSVLSSLESAWSSLHSRYTAEQEEIARRRREEEERREEERRRRQREEESRRSSYDSSSFGGGGSSFGGSFGGGGSSFGGSFGGGGSSVGGSF